MTEDKSNLPETADPPLAGVVARFESAEALLAAARAVRDAGYRRFDCHSPFPVHGLDRAMGIRRTRLPWIVMAAGLTGCTGALLLQWWTNAIDYPYIISGKPFFSLPANIPITFELIVLFSAFATFFGVLALNRLPQFRHPVLETERFGRATSDGFFLSIEMADPKFDENATVDELAALGAAEIEPAYDRTRLARVPMMIWWAAALLATLALLPPLLIARARVVKSDKPRIHIIQDMDFQPKYKTQAYSPFFEDRRTMRLPCPGTVAQGELDLSTHYNDGKVNDEWAKTIPLEVTDKLVQRGRDRFDVYCAACHGLVGDAEGGMTAIKAMERGDAGWVPPLSLHGPDIRKQPVGQVFGTISNGIRTMPSYAAQIPVEDRWAIILYVRALQLSQDAPLADVPKDERDKIR